MKNKNFPIRINEKDLATIKKKAKATGLSTTEYFTRCALNQPIYVVEGLPDFLKELKAIGTNLNQLTMLANLGRIETAHLYETCEAFGILYREILVLTRRRNHGDF